MNSTNASDIQTYTCMYCSGIWVNGQGIDFLLAKENSQLRVKDLAPLKQNSESNRECPKCVSSKLSAIEYKSTEIDICHSCHGIFFDEHEIKSLLPTSYKPNGQFDGTGIIVFDVILQIIFTALS